MDSINGPKCSSSTTTMKPEESTNSHVFTGSPCERKFLGCGNVEDFDKLDKIGQGTFGEVYKARCRKTNVIVALKRVITENEKEGFPITAAREIKILSKLNHQNIVNMTGIVTSRAAEFNHGKGSVYMVFEYMDHDLTGLLDLPGVKFTPAQVKCYMKQLLEGVHYLHKNKIIHRDMKGSNLLISNQGILKIADFGLARPFDELRKDYTNRVVTLWYRPPELLLGTTRYGQSIDLWGVGCIFAEMLLGKPLFTGKDEIQQLDMIASICGTPTEEVWPGVSELPFFKNFKLTTYKRRLAELFANRPDVNAKALDLMDKLLSLDPAKRPTASEALDHDYFWSEPLPANPADLPKYPPSHEYDRRKKLATGAAAPVQNLQRQRPPQHPLPQRGGHDRYQQPRNASTAAAGHELGDSRTTGNRFFRRPYPGGSRPHGHDGAGLAVEGEAARSGNWTQEKGHWNEPRSRDRPQHGPRHAPYPNVRSQQSSRAALDSMPLSSGHEEERRQLLPAVTAEEELMRHAAESSNALLAKEESRAVDSREHSLSARRRSLSRERPINLDRQDDFRHAKRQRVDDSRFPAEDRRQHHSQHYHHPHDRESESYRQSSTRPHVRDDHRDLHRSEEVDVERHRRQHGRDDRGHSREADFTGHHHRESRGERLAPDRRSRSREDLLRDEPHSRHSSSSHHAESVSSRRSTANYSMEDPFNRDRRSYRDRSPSSERVDRSSRSPRREETPRDRSPVGRAHRTAERRGRSGER